MSTEYTDRELDEILKADIKGALDTMSDDPGWLSKYWTLVRMGLIFLYKEVKDAG